MKSNRSPSTQPLGSPADNLSRTGRRRDGYVPYATCELCRKDGGCHFHIPSTSLVPRKKEKDPHLKVGRSTVFGLMKQFVDGVPVIEYSDVGGKRLLDGASKCRYLRGNKNEPSTRGGHRKKKTPEIKSVGPSASGLVPPPPPKPSPAGSSETRTY